jgi:glutathionylspermidine synthase
MKSRFPEMRRETLPPRLAWQARVEALGLDFHTTDGRPYWWEAACYGFSAVEVDVLEAATETLHRMCLEAVDRLVMDGQLGRVFIPEKYHDWVAASWRRRDPDLYGRFDLAFDGRHPPKLLEYNADTPTALLEAAVVQWYWMEQANPGRDQFNSIHERLIAAWAELRERHPKTSRVHFAGVLDVLEDLRTLEYMRDVCGEAGWPTSSSTSPRSVGTAGSSPTRRSGRSKRCSSSTPGNGCCRRASASTC